MPGARHQANWVMTLNISNGGTVSSSTGYLGYNSGATGAAW